MVDEQRRLLEQQLWNIANTLRGKMDADEFRDYILGFIFYKYLSEKMNAYADHILEADGITYQGIDEDSDEGKQYLEAIREETIESLGYFLKPSELFSAVARRGNGNGKHGNVFILEDLQRILNNIEQSTMGTDSEEDFDHLFEDLDLTSTKLGRTEAAKNELISKVLAHLDKIDFRLEDIEADVLGDAYEYLIAQFAAGAGKKAGEFYTPQEVSKVLAKLVTVGKERLKSVYDPTCGSGSLLLRVAREVKEVGKFYGQELNRTTYNLARMNMILHGVSYQKFDIKQEDSLEHPQHPDLRAEAVVANPPFSAKWSANPLHLGDDRFSQYGRLAPSSKADWAFIQHMIHHLAENGTMAVVAPHAVLFRGAAEAHIRRYLIEDRNYVDAIIGLPENLFFGTAIPTCIVVLKKYREHLNNILFVDASRRFGQANTKNYLREDDIERIISSYLARRSEQELSYVGTLQEIKANSFNLALPRYLNFAAAREVFNLEAITLELANRTRGAQELDRLIAKMSVGIGIPTASGNNVSLLLEYKRGVMQLLFSQEKRFKDANGKPFPDWNLFELRQIATRSTQKNTLGRIKLVLTNSATRGIVSQADYFDKSIVNTASLAGYYIVEVDDFVYNPRLSKSAPVGPIKRNKLSVGVMSPLYTVFRVEGVNVDFIEQYFESNAWHDYMRSIANYGARHDRMNISLDEFFEMPVLLPSEPEQRMIAQFLSLLDRRIELVRG
jgi:type I restriction enzyme M protein